jgi:hypothetical protein
MMHHLHHSTLPFRSQKCERQPLWSQTEGRRLGRPFESVCKSQRGFASGITRSSIFCPQPQGQIIPTHQSSSPSRASTMSRFGRRSGRLSPSTTTSRRRGPIFSLARRHFVPSSRSQVTTLISCILSAEPERVIQATAPWHHAPRSDPLRR